MPALVTSVQPVARTKPTEAALHARDYPLASVLYHEGDTLADTGVKAKDYPSVALIRIQAKSGQNTTCTGLIIHLDKVPIMLTAAHCAGDKSRKSAGISVIMGLNKSTESALKACGTKKFPTCRKFKTVKIIQYPMHGTPKCDPHWIVDTMGYDVALWIDSKHMRINDKTSVPPSSADVPITAIGWGQINVGNVKILKAATTTFIHKRT